MFLHTTFIALSVDVSGVFASCCISETSCSSVILVSTMICSELFPPDETVPPVFLTPQPANITAKVQAIIAITDFFMIINPPVGIISSAHNNIRIIPGDFMGLPLASLHVYHRNRKKYKKSDFIWVSTRAIDGARSLAEPEKTHYYWIYGPLNIKGRHKNQAKLRQKESGTTSSEVPSYIQYSSHKRTLHAFNCISITSFVARYFPK
jgi:hypothetical protein